MRTARQNGQKALAVLIDPDKITNLPRRVELSNSIGVDYFFVGGSLLSTDQLDSILTFLKKESNIPVVLFPGSVLQISKVADAILLLNLISGRNAEYLIGAHVAAVPALLSANIEIISTSYMLIDGGRPTTVTYISNTLPIPNDKPDIAAITAKAGQLIGHSVVYLDAGSGALYPVDTEVIARTRATIDSPIIVGGGMYTFTHIREAFTSGADIAVIGNAFESNPEKIQELSECRNV
jgi:putative glycerol-1-phosphate prenyltransferase